MAGRGPGRRRAVAALATATALGAATLTAATVPAAGPASAMTAPATASAPSVSASAAAVATTVAVSGVAAFGDSVPSGSNCRCTPFPGLVAAASSDSSGVAADLTNLARGGLTSAGLLAQVRTDPAQDAVAGSDVVLVTIGANDFSERIVTRWSCSAAAHLACYRTPLARLGTNLDALLHTIVTAQTHHGARVLVTGYWSVFKDGAVARARGRAYVRNTTALTVRVNAIVAAAAARNGAQYVDVFTPFRGNGSRDDTALLAADGDHPDARGHRVIADALLAALAAPGPTRP